MTIKKIGKEPTQSVAIPKELWREVKQMCLDKDWTVKSFVTEAVLEKMQRVNYEQK